MATVYLALGSNLGNRAANMRMALDTITRFIRIVEVSSLYETYPEPPGQPPYYNAAAKVEAGFEPLPLVRFLQGIEAEIGRRPDLTRNGPRPIDIDILLYDDLVLESDGLAVPHPRLTDRTFVLTPLAEIASDATHPVLGKTIAELSKAMGDGGARKVEEPGWHVRPDRATTGILGRGPAV